MFLGVDIGGTNIRVTAFRDLETRMVVGGDETKVSGEYARDYESLANLCGLMYGSYGEEYGKIEGIGVAIAGVLDAGRTTLAKAGNTRQWVGQPFIQDLAEQLRCSVALGNDAEAAAMAEAMYGNPEGQDFWFIIWGTGVGGALTRYRDGKAFAFAGEVGHVRVSNSGARECACGQADCLEAYCGGAMIRKYMDVPAELLTEDQWDEVLGRMVTGLRNAVTAQPVSKLYFGGGIAAKQRHLIPELEDLLRMELRIVEAPQMELSRFGESAGTVGALAMLKSELA